MNDNITTFYKTRTEAKEDGRLRFFFISVGKLSAATVKLVQYTPFLTAHQVTVYNLGFGDYDEVNDRINDLNISNNGDAYRIYNTVLLTVPVFFELNPLAMIFVQGSDSSAEYHEMCKMTCSKRCESNCKNSGRRIAIYRNYISKNLDILTENYIFNGGWYYDSNKKTEYEPFRIGEDYDTILVTKKIKYI